MIWPKLRVLIILCTTTLLCLSCESAPLALPWEQDTHHVVLIAHGLGAIDGEVKSDSLEALMSNYAKGIRVFEADIISTKDGRLALYHEPDAATGTGLTMSPRKLSLRSFLSKKLYGKYTTFSLEAMLRFLQAHPDTWLITDMKEKRIRNLDSAIAKEISTIDFSLFARIIPQGYFVSDLRKLSQLGFHRIIFTLYRQPNISDSNVLTIVKSIPQIRAVTMSAKRFSPSLTEHLSNIGVASFVHPLNDPKEISAFAKEDIAGIYTDTFTDTILRSDPLK